MFDAAFAASLLEEWQLCRLSGSETPARIVYLPHFALRFFNCGSLKAVKDTLISDLLDVLCQFVDSQLNHNDWRDSVYQQL